MEYTITMDEYSVNEGIKLRWIDNYEIFAKYDHGEIIISANKEGLLSLANHLVNLAQSSVPAGTHIHLDEYNSLEDDSTDVIIEKVE